MGKRGLAIGGLGCGVLIICILVGGTLMMANGINQLVQPEEVIIQVKAPAAAAQGEPFVLAVTVTNRLPADTAVTFHSLDISHTYLAGLSPVAFDPPPQRELSLPLVDFQSYLFRQPLPTPGTAVFSLSLQGHTPGRYAGPVDVCINTASLCQRFEISTEILP